MTASVYKMYIIRGFKVTRKYFPQKHDKKNIFCYWLFEEVCDLTFDF